MVSKHDFVKRISDASDGLFTQREVTGCIDFMSGVLTDIIKEKEAVKLGNVVTISGELKPAHTARNPKTGGTVEVPDRVVPKAKFSKTVKEAINA